MKQRFSKLYWYHDATLVESYLTCDHPFWHQRTAIPLKKLAYGLSEHKIEHRFHDVRTDGLKLEEIEEWIAKTDLGDRSKSARNNVAKIRS